MSIIVAHPYALNSRVISMIYRLSLPRLPCHRRGPHSPFTLRQRRKGPECLNLTTGDWISANTLLRSSLEMILAVAKRTP
jgi:hypothetical protein